MTTISFDMIRSQDVTLNIFSVKELFLTSFGAVCGLVLMILCGWVITKEAKRNYFMDVKKVLVTYRFERNFYGCGR